MMGRFAPGANVLPMMPGLVCRESVIVWPLVDRTSRSVTTVTELKVSSVTISVPGKGSRTGVSSAWTAGAADALGAGPPVRRVGFLTGLGVVTSIGGNSVAAA
jgi:hypothetical protein